MNDVVPSFQPETGQVMLWGSSAGVAGEAFLTPVPDLELAFDRADGSFCWAIVHHVTTAWHTCVGEQVAALLTRLFGPAAPGVVRAAAMSPGQVPPGTGVLTPDPVLAGALSSLARLDAARATSPVLRCSPLWAKETAELAERAGLPALASAQRGPRLAIPPTVPALDVAAEVESLKRHRAHPPRLQWMLGRGAVREGPFQFGLSPYSDLAVRQRGQRQIAIEALLAPGADCAVLSDCQVRVIDPEIRRVLDQASFAMAGSMARAELRSPFPLDEVPECWIEVVRSSKCPVGSLKEQRGRRARRWADTALRAERAPAGLDPEATPGDWSALAVAAWELCCFDWAAAGDADRAYLALTRRAAMPGADKPRADMPRAPSRTAAEIAGRVSLPGPAYLAEERGKCRS